MSVTEIAFWYGASTIIRFPEQQGHATGFFYESNGEYYLVTNKHVVISTEISDAEEMSGLSDDDFFDEINIHLRNPSDISQIWNHSLELFDDSGSRRWYEHPDLELDLVVIPLGVPLDNYGNSAFNQENIGRDDIRVSGGDLAIVVGYPHQALDQQSYFPVARNALISSPYIPGQGPFFLMDARMHGGTSGSPVLALPLSVQNTPDGGTAMFSGSPIYLLGVHSATLRPQISSSIQVPDTPSDEANMEEQFEYLDSRVDSLEDMLEQVLEQFDSRLDLNRVWYAEWIEEILQRN